MEYTSNQAPGTSGLLDLPPLEPRSGGRVLKGRKTNERGAGLALLPKLLKKYPRDPRRQARDLLHGIDLPALTGRQRKVSQQTVLNYEWRINKVIGDLADMNIRLGSIDELSVKHATRLVTYWEEQGCSASHIQNSFTVVRRMLRWLGKDAQLPPLSQMLKNPAAGKRRLIAVESRSLTANGLSPEDLLAKAMDRDETFGHQLALMHAFGLRPKEALMIRPVQADRGDRLSVELGTKNGKPRLVPIVNEGQRRVLDAAKEFTRHNPKRPGSFLEGNLTIEQAKNRMIGHARAIGMTKGELGITLYSWRHEFAHWMFEALTGSKPPVAGGEIDKKTDEQARGVLSVALGHHRKSVVGAYCGTVATMSRVGNKRLKQFLEDFQDEKLRQDLSRAGITSVVLVGPAARGIRVPNDIFNVYVEGPPGAQEACRAGLEAALGATISFASRELASKAADTFELF